MTVRAKVLCEECDEWHPVEEGTKHVECGCGTLIAITITPLSNPT